MISVRLGLTLIVATSGMTATTTVASAIAGISIGIAISRHIVDCD